MIKKFIIIAIFILFFIGFGFFVKESGKKNLEGNPELSKEILSKNPATSSMEQQKPLFNSPSIEKKVLITPLVKTEVDLPLKSSVSISPATTTLAIAISSGQKLPPLDRTSLLKAVVKIQCPASDGLSKYVGSGFVLKGGIVATAAHVVKDSASDTCEIIFPHERKPIHYLYGVIENLKEVKRRHDEEGIDFATIKLPDIDSYKEAKDIFSDYPYIHYPICENPKMLGDSLLHFGYPSNYADQSYLSEQKGEAVVYLDIKGIKDALSEDQTFTYKTPIFFSSFDQSNIHPYMVSRVASFYGDSGGLAFNETKQCILGPHRGGTIGKASGENYSVFMIMGWEKVKNLY